MKSLKHIPRAKLQDLYFVKNLSHRSIATKLGVSEPTVRARFRDYGFTARERGSWLVKYPKTAFKGAQQEKAYLLGFRAGDLNVYVPSLNSKIIVVRPNSTDACQIQLMQSLFCKYGGVTVSGKSKVKNVNCFLDKSFSFLIPKPYNIENWITDKNENALAFMAGYIDAEGNFIVSQKRARFKLDSYDEEILHWMHQWLLANSIRSKLRIIGERGKTRYGSGQWNSDIWRLNVNEANSLLKFCELLNPYLHHKKRVEDVNLCVENIKLRKINGTV